jgi:hypothetical protein
VHPVDPYTDILRCTVHKTLSNGINFATEGLCSHAVSRRDRTGWLGRGQKCQFDTRYENDGLIVVWGEVRCCTYVYELITGACSQHFVRGGGGKTKLFTPC